MKLLHRQCLAQIMILCMLIVNTPHAQAIVLNEILNNPDTGENEAIELFADQETNLSGMVLKKQTTSSQTILYRFGSGENLQNGEHRIINTLSSTLSNTNLHLLLVDESGTTLDEVSVGNQTCNDSHRMSTGTLCAPQKWFTLARVGDMSPFWSFRRTGSIGNATMGDANNYDDFILQQPIITGQNETNGTIQVQTQEQAFFGYYTQKLLLLRCLDNECETIETNTGGTLIEGQKNDFRGYDIAVQNEFHHLWQTFWSLKTPVIVTNNTAQSIQEFGRRADGSWFYETETCGSNTGQLLVTGDNDSIWTFDPVSCEQTSDRCTCLIDTEDSVRNPTGSVTLSLRSESTEIAYAEADFLPLSGSFFWTQTGAIWTPHSTYNAPNTWTNALPQATITGSNLQETIVSGNRKLLLDRVITPDSPQKIILQTSDSDGDTVTVWGSLCQNTICRSFTGTTLTISQWEGTGTLTADLYDWYETGTVLWNIEAPQNTAPQAVITMQGTCQDTHTIGCDFNRTGENSSDKEQSVNTLFYVWDFGDGRVFSGTGTQGKNPVAQEYRQTGSYVLKLTVQDSFGLRNTVEKLIQVTPKNVGGSTSSNSQNPSTTAQQTNGTLSDTCQIQRISEVFPDPAGTDSKQEFFELDVSNSPCSLTGVSVSIETGNKSNVKKLSGSCDQRFCVVKKGNHTTTLTLPNNAFDIKILIWEHPATQLHVPNIDTHIAWSYQYDRKRYVRSLPSPGSDDPLHTGNITCLVTRVIDGDTFLCQYGETLFPVRLLGTDTPETVDPRKTVQYFGYQASHYSKTHLAQAVVNITFDPTDAFDRYSRLLWWVTPQGMTETWNEHLIREWYARAYRLYNIAGLDRCISAEMEAQTNKKGIWGEVSVAEIESTLEMMQQEEAETTTDTGSTLLKEITKKLKKAKTAEKKEQKTDEKMEWKNILPTITELRKQEKAKAKAENKEKKSTQKVKKEPKGTQKKKKPKKKPSDDIIWNTEQVQSLLKQWKRPKVIIPQAIIVGRNDATHYTALVQGKKVTLSSHNQLVLGTSMTLWAQIQKNKKTGFSLRLYKNDMQFMTFWPHRDTGKKQEAKNILCDIWGENKIGDEYHGIIFPQERYRIKIVFAQGNKPDKNDILVIQNANIEEEKSRPILRVHQYIAVAQSHNADKLRGLIQASKSP